MAQEPNGALIRCARLEGGRTGPRAAGRPALSWPPYLGRGGWGWVADQKPLILLVSKGIAAVSALLSAAELEFGGKPSVRWLRAFTLNVYWCGSPRESLGGGHGPM
jgi:hypothetical protein